ncbi:YjbH domain-containing protein, partial [Gammaproteobacteria bacterium]|nr:YjbH domain-containing protein [Gammaproteobacteria bacterium]
MPDARMTGDGDLIFSLALDDLANLYNVSFQALPRVQATFRYSIFGPNLDTGSLDTVRLRDRSYGVKGLLIKETGWRPAIAVGARDLLGTGAWSSEYIVASKKWTNLDFTLGVGWGRLGSRDGFDNPLGLLNSKFESRPDAFQQTGRVLGGSFFRGDASIFGGLAYRIPSLSLTFLAEYESDQYDREVGFGSLDYPSAVNFGFTWQPISDISLRLSWLRGDTLGVTVSSRVATKRIAPRKYERRKPSSNLDKGTGLPEGYDPESWYDRMVYESEQSGLYLRRASLVEGQRKATMQIENRAYNLTADALNQIMALSELHTPPHVSSVDLILQENGYVGPTINYSLQRGDSSNLARDDAYDQIKILAPRRIEKPTNRTDFGYPSLGFGLDLAGRVQLMDPDDPARKQIFAKLTGRLQLTDHVNLWGRYEQNLYNDFSTARDPGSGLPNVRTL